MGRPIDINEKTILLRELHQIRNLNDLPWIIAGDFHL